MKGTHATKDQLIKELKRSEEKYRNIVESSPDGILTVNTKGFVTSFNEAFSKLTGYSKEEFTGKHLTKLPTLDKRDIPKYLKIFALILVGKKIKTPLEFTWIHKDGTRRLGEYYYSLIRSKGKIKGVQVIARDITEKKKTEEELRNSENYLDEAQRIAHVGSWEWNIASTKEIWSGETHRIFGVPKSFKPTYERYMALIHKEDRNKVASAVEQAVKNGEEININYRIIKPNKDERIINSQGKAYFDRKGKATKVIGTCQDITEKKKKEERLNTIAKENLRFRKALDQVSSYIYIKDLQSRYQYANELTLKLFRCSIEELVGCRDSRFFPPDTAKRLRQIDLRVFQGERTTEVIESKSESGERQVYLEVKTPVYSEIGGEIVGLLGISTDITERKKAEEALLREKDKAQKYLDIAGVFILAINTAGEVTLINQKGCEVLGYQEEEIVGKNWFDNFLPARIRKETKAYSIKLLRGEIEPVEYHENPVLTKSGEKRLIAWHNTLLKDDTGNIIGHLSSGEDITERKELEGEIKVVKERYDRVTDNADEAIFRVEVIPGGGKNVYINSAAERIFGYSLDEYLNDPSLSSRMLHPDYKQQEQEVLKEISQTKKPVKDVTLGWIAKDGRTVIMEYTIIPIYDKDDRLVYFESIGRDITERKKAEEYIQKSNALLSSVINSPDNIIVFALDTDYKYLSFNKAHAKEMKLVYDAEIEIGKNIIDYIPSENDRAKVLINYKRVLRGERFTEIQQYGLGDESSWYELIFNPIYDDSNNTTGFTVFVTNITDRKKAEEALKESEERYRSIFDEARDGIVLVERETGSIIDCNAEFEYQTGRALKQLQEMKIWELIHHKKTQIAKEKFLEIQKAGMGGSSELEFLKPNGEIVFIDFLAKQINIKGRKLLQSISRDITTRKQEEQEKQQLRDKAEMSSRLATVGEMAAGIAHEINNPLTGVIGFSQMLMQEDVSPEIKEQLKIINDGSQRVKEIVRRMLTFARQTKPVKTSINVHELIDNTLEIRGYVLKTANIKVIKDYDPDLPWITADPGQLQQVFLNIIVNAEYAMKKAHGKGSITITTSKTDDHIRLIFKDDGPGMTEEVKTKLFQPFYTTKDPGEGTGLGLSMSRAIILEHNGTIEVVSKPSIGTTFVIELPFAPLSESTEKPPVKTPAPKASKRKARVLVVDDEPAIRSLIKTILTRKGHTVEETGKPDEVFIKLEQASYDIILLDIRMPGMSGIELYKNVIKKYPKLGDRFVFITGDTSDSETMAFLNYQNLSYIAKPFSREALEEKVNWILSK